DLGATGLVGHAPRDVARRHQRAGRTGLDALAARDARRVAHRVVEVEHDLGVTAPERVADDVVHLLLATGANAALALNAGVEVHGHRRMRKVLDRLRAGVEARLAHAHLLRPEIELRV